MVNQKIGTQQSNLLSTLFASASSSVGTSASTSLPFTKERSTHGENKSSEIGQETRRAKRAKVILFVYSLSGFIAHPAYLEATQVLIDSNG
nr:hypothetical protein [Candidatus Njordarchaeota archaeon]